jgi:hypothetical protein
MLNAILMEDKSRKRDRITLTLRVPALRTVNCLVIIGTHPKNSTQPFFARSIHSRLFCNTLSNDLHMDMNLRIEQTLEIQNSYRAEHRTSTMPPAAGCIATETSTPAQGCQLYGTHWTPPKKLNDRPSTTPPAAGCIATDTSTPAQGCHL